MIQRFAPDAFWRSRLAPIRPYLIQRGVYLLLAFDLWLEMVEHGGRYAVGGFNVAHFAWLDWLLPLPSPALYVGLLIGSGYLALLLALGAASRALQLVLALTYTLSWMLSMHDSYQHHYLLSWLLLWSVAYPRLGIADLAQEQRRPGWGPVMTAVTCAIVYAFTAISKSEPEWRNGDVLRALTHTRPPGHPEPGKFDGMRDQLLTLGLSDAQFWQLLAVMTIALQWTISLAYLAAAQRDERPTRVRTLLTGLGLLAAFGFHAAAELFHIFEIGLFSYYMLWIAWLLLVPAQALAPFTLGLLWLRKRAEPHLCLLHSTSRQMALGSYVASCAVLLSAGLLIPLPGALAATCSLTAVLLARLLARRGRRQAEPLAWAARVTLASVAMCGALAWSQVPFDYYRRTAGELRKMERLQEALTMYRRAEQYAPQGQSRASVMREIEAELEQGAAAKGADR